LLAGNVELRKSLRLPLIGRLFGNSSLAVFFDTGRLTDLTDSAKQLSNAGAGITFNKQWPDDWYTFIIGTNYTLRLDFPLWVSAPRLKSNGSKEDEFKFRYVLSFQRAL
jgi:hypothetical protein